MSTHSPAGSLARILVAVTILAATTATVTLAPRPAFGLAVDCSRGVNLSFEQPVINQNWQIVAAPGWATSGSGTEIWQSGFLGATAPDGAQLGELQADDNSPSWQDIPTLPGDEIAWSFYHRGRVNPDRVLVNIGSTSSQTNEGDFTTGTVAFTRYSDTYVVPSGQTTTRFVLDPVDTGSVGNLVDAVAFNLTCEVSITSALAGVDDIDGSGSVTEGDVFTFSYDVSNTGTATLDTVSVVDALGGTAVCPVSSLAPGESATCELQHPVSQAEIDAGSIESDATISGTDAAGTTVTASDTESVPLEQLPVIELEKSGTADVTLVAPMGRPDPGDVVNYSFVVTNQGNVTLTSIAIDDPVVGPVACPTDPLPPLGQLTCSGAYTIGQEDIDSARVDNTATAFGQPPTGDAVSDEDSVSVDLEQVTSVDITKSAATTEYDTVNDVITYDIVVTNTGNIGLSDVEVTDSSADAGSIQCAPALPGTIDPGGTAVCSAERTVTQADLDAGSITNVASVHAQGTVNDVPVSDDSEPVVLTAIANLDLDVSKTESNTPLGDGRFAVTYTVSVTNTGNVTATGVSISDALVDVFGPNGWTVEAVSSVDFTVNDSYDGISDVQLVAGTDSLAPNETGTVLLEVTVDPKGEPGPHLNVASVELTTGQLSSNADASASSLFDVTFDLSVSKKSATHVAPGGNLTWTIEVSNDGPSATLGPITVTDMLSDQLTFVSASGAGWVCTQAHGTVTCVRDGLLASGDSSSLEIVTVVDAELGDKVSNSVSVTSADAFNDVDASNRAAVASANVDMLPVTGMDTADVGVVALSSILLGLALLVVTGRKKDRRTV